jgi:hypothetical protein
MLDRITAEKRLARQQLRFRLQFVLSITFSGSAASKQCRVAHIHTNYRRKSTITSSGHQRPPIQCLLLTQSGHERLRIAALRDVDRDPLGLPFRATSCSGRVNSSGGLEKFTAHDLSGSALVWAPIIRVEP